MECVSIVSLRHEACHPSARMHVLVNRHTTHQVDCVLRIEALWNSGVQWTRYQKCILDPISEIELGCSGFVPVKGFALPTVFRRTRYSASFVTAVPRIDQPTGNS